MSIFKKASKERLRFETKQGALSTEQLWDLKLTPLALIVRNLKKQLTKSNDDELSFLDEAATPIDATVQLKFDVVKAIYLDRKSERDSEKDEAVNKEHNAKIDALIAQKQDESLGSKSIEELEAMRRN